MKRYVCMMMVLFVFIFTCACSASAEESATTSNPAAAAEESTAVAEETPATAEETPTTPEDSNRINYLILVNEENAIPDDWEANLNLAPTTNAEGQEIELEAETLEQFTKLHDALLEENVDVEITVGFRSVEAQQRIMDGFIEQRGEEYAKENITSPGYSELHTGLAFDICFIKEGLIQDDKEYMYSDNPKQFRKLYAKLPEYGFIVRYPEGKEDVTGHEFEPWHIRYVGSPEVAQEITDQGITLEEYLAK